MQKKKINHSFWFTLIIYLLVVYKKKRIIHSFWSTFVKDLKRNFSCKIYKKPHKNSKKVVFFCTNAKVLEMTKMLYKCANPGQTKSEAKYIILNTSRNHVNYKEDKNKASMNKPYNIQNTNICNGIFHISFFKALLINKGETTQAVKGRTGFGAKRPGTVSNKPPRLLLSFNLFLTYPMRDFP
jgi:hypothetical protein